MKFLFTKNNKWTSKLALYLSEEPVCHIAIEFSTLNLVIDSSTTGVKISRSKTFKRKNEVIKTFDLKVDKWSQIFLFNETLDQIEGLPYDFMAYFQLVLWGIGRKFFKMKPPVANPMQKPNSILCSEVIYPLFPYLLKRGYDLYKIDLTAVSPWMVYCELERQQKEHEARNKRC